MNFGNINEYFRIGEFLARGVEDVGWCNEAGETLPGSTGNYEQIPNQKSNGSPSESVWYPNANSDMPRIGTVVEQKNVT